VSCVIWPSPVRYKPARPRKTPFKTASGAKCNTVFPVNDLSKRDFGNSCQRCNQQPVSHSRTAARADRERMPLIAEEAPPAPPADIAFPEVGESEERLAAQSSCLADGASAQCQEALHNSFSSQTARATQCGYFLNNQGARSQAVRSVAHPS
jgi:hypothetical protein